MLTQEAKQAILCKVKQQGMSFTSVAEEYGITKGVVAGIINRAKLRAITAHKKVEKALAKPIPEPVKEQSTLTPFFLTHPLNCYRCNKPYMRKFRTSVTCSECYALIDMSVCVDTHQEAPSCV